MSYIIKRAGMHEFSGSYYINPQQIATNPDWIEKSSEWVDPKYLHKLPHPASLGEGYRYMFVDEWMNEIMFEVHATYINVDGNKQLYQQYWIQRGYGHKPKTDDLMLVAEENEAY